jgi:hypothetical protein
VRKSRGPGGRRLSHLWNALILRHFCISFDFYALRML